MSWITRAGLEEPRDNSPNGADVQPPTTSDNTDEWLDEVLYRALGMTFIEPEDVEDDEYSGWAIWATEMETGEVYKAMTPDDFEEVIAEAKAVIQRNHASEVQAAEDAILERAYWATSTTSVWQGRHHDAQDAIEALQAEVKAERLNHLTTEEKQP
jgi:hypothetical protein